LSHETVMAGLRPGHPRLSRFNCRQDVDARHKAGHDDKGGPAHQQQASSYSNFKEPRRIRVF
jgi:hypothetical protein